MSPEGVYGGDNVTRFEREGWLRIRGSVGPTGDFAQSSMSRPVFPLTFHTLREGVVGAWDQYLGAVNLKRTQ